MDTFRIIKNFPVESSQFFIEANCSILISFFALISVWTVAAIFTLIDFFLPAIQISFDWLPVCKVEFFSIRTDQIAILIRFEILCTEWIVAVFLVCCLFLVHRELHELFHSMFLAEQIVVVRVINWNLLFMSFAEGIILHQTTFTRLAFRVFVNLAGDVVHRFVGRFRDVVVHHGNADIFFAGKTQLVRKPQFSPVWPATLSLRASDSQTSRQRP